MTDPDIDDRATKHQLLVADLVRPADAFRVWLKRVSVGAVNDMTGFVLVLNLANVAMPPLVQPGETK